MELIRLTLGPHHNQDMGERGHVRKLSLRWLAVPVGESQPPLPGKSSDATAVASGEKNMAKNIKEIKGQVR